MRLTSAEPGRHRWFAHRLDAARDMHPIDRRLHSAFRNDCPVFRPATKITSGGKPASAMDLKVGQKVKCLIQKVGEEMMCTSLEVMK